MSRAPQVGELQALIGRVDAVRSTIHGYGDPSRLAGDPGALRDLAASHLDAAGDLQAALDTGQGPARGLTGGPWQGAASGAFGDGESWPHGPRPFHVVLQVAEEQREALTARLAEVGFSFSVLNRPA